MVDAQNVGTMFGKRQFGKRQAQIFTYDLGETNSFAGCYELIMARPLRISYPNAVYHVTCRGKDRKNIFGDDRDRDKFLELLGRAVEEFYLGFHCYILMSNHYHLLLETPKGNPNRALHYINGVYTQRFNRCHRRGRSSVSGKI